MASREQQIVIAERVLAHQGRGAWPVCGPEVIDHVLDYLRFVADLAADAVRSDVAAPVLR